MAEHERPSMLYMPKSSPTCWNLSVANQPLLETGTCSGTLGSYSARSFAGVTCHFTEFQSPALPTSQACECLLNCALLLRLWGFPSSVIRLSKGALGSLYPPTLWWTRGPVHSSAGWLPWCPMMTTWWSGGRSNHVARGKQSWNFASLLFDESLGKEDSLILRPRNSHLPSRLK